MKNKDIAKYFYEVIISDNLLDEISKYISEDCVQRIGEKNVHRNRRNERTPISIEKNVS